MKRDSQGRQLCFRCQCVLRADKSCPQCRGHVVGVQMSSTLPGFTIGKVSHRQDYACKRCGFHVCNCAAIVPPRASPSPSLMDLHERVIAASAEMLRLYNREARCAVVPALYEPAELRADLVPGERPLKMHTPGGAVNVAFSEMRGRSWGVVADCDSFTAALFGYPGDLTRRVRFSLVGEVGSAVDCKRGEPVTPVPCQTPLGWLTETARRILGSALYDVQPMASNCGFSIIAEGGLSMHKLNVPYDICAKEQEHNAGERRIRQWAAQIGVPPRV